MINYWRFIRFDSSYLVMASLSVITGMFENYFWLTFILLIHDMGHYFFIKRYNWNLKKIVIYPFGGIIELEESLNRPIKEEFFIVLGGYLSQIILWVFIFILYNNKVIDYYSYQLFIKYNLSIFLFNLIPLYPLDGFKLFNLGLELLFPYYTSFKISNFISIILSLFLIFYFHHHLSFILMIILLIYKTIIIYKQRNYLFDRFLLERYLNQYQFSKIRIIKGNKIKKVMRGRRHIFYYNNQYVTEKAYLKLRYFH